MIQSLMEPVSTTIPAVPLQQRSVSVNMRVDVDGAAHAHDSHEVDLAPLNTVGLPREHVASLEAVVSDKEPNTIVQSCNKAKMSLTVSDFAQLEENKPS